VVDHLIEEDLHEHLKGEAEALNEVGVFKDLAELAVFEEVQEGIVHSTLQFHELPVRD
jgi:hypothetical protein